MTLDELYMAWVPRTVEPNAGFEPLTFKLVAERQTFETQLQDFVSNRSSHWPDEKNPEALEQNFAQSEFLAESIVR